MYFEVNQKIRLFYRVWEPEDITDIKGIVVIVHGYAEHSGRYEKAAQYIADSGFRVFAPDLPGHGQSTGKKGLVEDIFPLAVYLKNFTDYIKTDNKKIPIFILGHSMGGGISLLYTSSFGCRIDGLITSAAAVHPLPYPPRLIRFILSLIAPYFPRFKTMKLDADKISTLEDVVDKYKNDPLNYNGRVMAGTGTALYKMRKIVEAKAVNIIEPILLLHGSKDSLASPSGSRKVFDTVSSEDKQIIIYEGCRHEILNDFRQDEVLEDICSWLSARV